ncbi:WhiB family transcriptional regulator [Kineococcus sp. SYSU DK004]|uniref:WhiB family transcriptional regulator n=1 Tax=Kineococcus sp. SYSU DK004 TaxID=3383125 RepID=UPI003D7EBFFC
MTETTTRTATRTARAALRPTSDDWDWQLRGSCREADPELFFHPELERGAARQHRDAAALAICAECPVLRRCREHVLRHREAYGVWGGLTEDQREEMWSRRPDRRLRRAG